MKRSVWDARIQRAQKLSDTYPSARDVLRFYVRVAELQRGLDEQISPAAFAKSEANPAWPAVPDLARLLPAFPSFLDCVASSAPNPLAEFAAAWKGESSRAWQESLTRYWSDVNGSALAENPGELFCARAFLQPYAESLARARVVRSDGSAPRLCPVCGRKPQVGVLRPEGDGGKKFLICSFCATEWEFRRILCPSCGEGDEKKQCLYTAEGFPQIRIEACDTCKTFIECVDMTRDGHAVPIVDEIAAIPPALWAAEKGYTKLQPNLLGM